jgi:hypothetical protein
MVGAFFTTLFAKISSVVAWFSSLFVAIFVSLWDIFKDVFSWLFEQVLTVSITAVSSIDTSAVSNAAAGGWGSLPGDVLNILQLIGVGQAITIIASSIVIRLGLQLIPFVRLGS